MPLEYSAALNLIEHCFRNTLFPLTENRSSQALNTRYLYMQSHRLNEDSGYPSNEKILFFPVHFSGFAQPQPI
jgi:hypothetical protein